MRRTVCHKTIEMGKIGLPHNLHDEEPQCVIIRLRHADPIVGVIREQQNEAVCRGFIQSTVVGRRDLAAFRAK